MEEQEVKTKVWLCVDENGDENICDAEPVRSRYWWYAKHPSTIMPIPAGTIFKLTGRKLTWEDEPFELTEEFFK